MPTALITGVSGQDGGYLAEFLLQKGYQVVGTVRDRARESNRVAHLANSVELVELDLTSLASVENMLREFRPDEFYNLAARASGSELWCYPVLTGEVNGLAVTRLLEAIHKVDGNIRFCQASSSEIFGNAVEVPQNENTPLRPRNPYGAAKAYAHWITSNYRDVRGLFAGSTILYNHESPRRPPEFVTRKISRAAARIKLGPAAELRLGNLEARRDWRFAGDYVAAMWLSLQQPVPDDDVVASGEPHSVREFCDIAFSHLGLDYHDYVVQDEENFRVPETTPLVGNPAKAKQVLGWRPNVPFDALVRMMVDADLRAAEKLPYSPDEQDQRH